MGVEGIIWVGTSTHGVDDRAEKNKTMKLTMNTCQVLNGKDYKSNGKYLTKIDTKVKKWVDQMLTLP